MQAPDNNEEFPEHLAAMLEGLLLDDPQEAAPVGLPTSPAPHIPPPVAEEPFHIPNRDNRGYHHHWAKYVYSNYRYLPYRTSKRQQECEDRGYRHRDTKKGKRFRIINQK